MLEALRKHPLSSGGTLALRAREAVGRLGIITQCRSLVTDAGGPRLFAVQAEHCQSSILFGEEVVGAAGGIGLTERDAALSAVGEALERYASARCDSGALRLATARELGDAAIGFDRFSYFNDKQIEHPEFPFSRWSADARIRWARARSLHDGGERWIPAAAIYVPYTPVSHEDRGCLAVSSGQACHGDPSLATLTGLYEVIERDAFSIAWLQQLPLERVDFRASPYLAELHRRHLDGCGIEYHLFDMTTDIRVPSFLCLAERRRGEGSIFGAGAATRLDEVEAIQKALLEATHTLLYAHSLVKSRPSFDPGPDYLEVREFEDHVRLFCEPSMKPHLDFLLNSPRRRPASTATREPPGAEAALAECLARLQEAGLEAVEVDLTPPDVEALGLRVVKVFVPGAVPLLAIHALPPAGCRRLWTVPEKLGHPLSSRRLNRIPHPFP